MIELFQTPRSRVKDPNRLHQRAHAHVMIHASYRCFLVCGSPRRPRETLVPPQASSKGRNSKASQQAAARQQHRHTNDTEGNTRATQGEHATGSRALLSARARLCSLSLPVRSDGFEPAAPGERERERGSAGHADARGTTLAREAHARNTHA